MKTISKLLALFSLVLLISSCERIDAGHEGIKVNLYGDSKGVDDVSLVSGVIWYNPFTTKVYEYPTYAQTIDYEAFEVNSKDGTKFTIDPSMIVSIKTGNSPVIFKKYRKKLDEVIEGSLYIYVKDAARIVFNSFTADSIISNRELVDKALDTKVRESFDSEGFLLEQLTPGIAYPKSYEDAINAKNKAVQERMRVENEILVDRANAERILINAQAEKEANELRTKALTPEILQQMWIEKWSGQVPTVITNGNSSMFMDISTLRK